MSCDVGLPSSEVQLIKTTSPFSYWPQSTTIASAQLTQANRRLLRVRDQRPRHTNNGSQESIEGTPSRARVRAVQAVRLPYLPEAEATERRRQSSVDRTRSTVLLVQHTFSFQSYSLISLQSSILCMLEFFVQTTNELFTVSLLCSRTYHAEPCHNAVHANDRSCTHAWTHALICSTHSTTLGGFPFLC